MRIAKPLHYRVHVEEVGQDLLLRRRTGSFRLVIVLVLALALWTVWGPVLLGIDGQLVSLSAWPYWGAWLLLAFALNRAIFGTEILQIGPDGLVLRKRALVPHSEQTIPLDEVRKVKPGTQVNRRAQWVTHLLEIETTGGTIAFGLGVDRIEALWLADRLDRHLQSLVPGWTIEHRAEDTAESEPIEVPRRGTADPGPPPGSTIRFRTEFDRHEFRQRGSIGLAALDTLDGRALFAFVFFLFPAIMLWTSDWWPAWLSQMPMKGPGLCLALGACWMILAPFRMERLRIGPGEISGRSSLFGVGRTRFVDPQDLGRIELRKGPVGGMRRLLRRLRPRPSDEDDATICSLRFLDRDDRIGLMIVDLNEAEARWMAGVACRVLDGWLPRAGGAGTTPPPAARAAIAASPHDEGDRT